ncbi:MAG: ABC transporter permease [Bacilli bacterium]|nr:ABC transporter permease [Bacilli bacterium]
MTNKLIFLIKNSFLRKIKSKWFLIANIILVTLIIGIMNVDSIIKLFGGEYEEKTKVYIVDNTNYTFDLIENNIKNTKIIEDQPFEIIKENKTKKELKKQIKKDEIIIIVNEDKENIIDANIISKGYIDSINYQIILSAINNTKIALAIKKSDIDPNELNSIYKEVNIKREYLDKNKQSEDENMEMIISTVFPFVILPFFMLSIFLIQTIGAEVNDEKQTRGMEIIISNVSPTTHFMSKIISGNAFVIMQAIMLFLYSIIGILIRKGINIGSSNIENKIIEVINNVSTTEFMNSLVYIIPLTLILMLLTLIAYSLVAAVLASMTTNSEDFGQLQSPIIIISLIGYYLSMIAGMFKGSIFIRILSYVPFISAILSPSLLVLNQINIIDIIISISIMILTNFLIIKYGIKIYKAGILNYSSKNLWKKMFKAIKN